MMLLIGQYDSPFVRRVGIALTLFEIPFRHEPWSVFRQADKIAAVNPLIRVPTLVLDDGTMLTESHIILDYLESRAPRGRGLFPRREPKRHQALRVCGLATGIGDKVVSLFYEKRLHDKASDIWVKRCEQQILATFALLESERAAQKTRYWLGLRLTHADIVVACIFRFAQEAHPGLIGEGAYPALRTLSASIEKLPAFRAIEQPFIAPA
jgi:glutathione S-transferase